MCTNCGEIMRVSTELTLRRLTDADLKELARQPVQMQIQISSTQAEIRAQRKARNN